MLDPIVWHVGAYDYVTGNTVLVRGPRGGTYLDQFSVANAAAGTVSTRDVTGRIIVRDESVRRAVLERAGGYCELCKEPGFTMPNGAVYIGTHHIIPLSEDGPDIDTNVIALCPNHHRRTHYGVDNSKLKAEFIQIIKAKAVLEHRKNPFTHRHRHHIERNGNVQGVSEHFDNHGRQIAGQRRSAGLAMPLKIATSFFGFRYQMVSLLLLGLREPDSLPRSRSSKG